MNPTDNAIVIEELRKIVEKSANNVRKNCIQNNSVTFDGDITGRPILFDRYVRLSENAISFNAVKQFTLFSSGDGEHVHSKDKIEYGDMGHGMAGWAVDDTPYILTLTDGFTEDGIFYPPGTYGLFYKDDTLHVYVSSIEGTIDPKFIPGAPLFDLTEMGLPTVELGSMAMVENIDVSEISAAMDAGNIRIKTLVSIDGAEMDVYANLLPAYLPAAQAREATTVLSFDGKIYAVILTVSQSNINLAVSEV